MANKTDAIQHYILAKDSNRPFLLNKAFTENATLQMVVWTDSIAFPPSSIGREAIADTLVRQFNQKYENIYTICIGVRPEIELENFSCNWMVVMTEKKNGSLRVGCGRYDWTFGHTENKIQALTITIDIMETVTLSSLAPAIVWVSSLSYPWCEISTVAKALPDIPAVHRVVRHLCGQV